MVAILKYPRTPHIEGSRFGPGDEDLHGVPFAHLAGRELVLTEKLDGANCGLRFDAGGKLHLQSRGHFLTGGGREKHFNFFKQWGAAVAHALWPVLGARYALYGEWLYAKHTIFYDELPHYFLELDVLDTASNTFLSTPRRRELLAGLPVVSVPVLYEGAACSYDEMLALIGRSRFKGPQWRDHLAEAARAARLSWERAWQETDHTDLMEGLYIKVEEPGQVVERFKYVRGSFLTSVVDSGTHWLKRPIVPNRLADGVALFGGGEATFPGAP
jgi:hypothetical protein